jgi:hypothetical protein
VSDEQIAIKLANRWVNEKKQKEKGYSIIGIDKYYSPLD